MPVCPIVVYEPDRKKSINFIVFSPMDRNRIKNLLLRCVCVYAGLSEKGRLKGRGRMCEEKGREKERNGKIDRQKNRGREWSKRK